MKLLLFFLIIVRKFFRKRINEFFNLEADFGYDEHLVLEGVSFEVKKGEQITLSGRTGAGKSTILKLLLGLYEPQSGSIRIGNIPATEVPEEERRTGNGNTERNPRKEKKTDFI